MPSEIAPIITPTIPTPNVPSMTPMSTSTTPSNTEEDQWQVFFLPKDDPVVPSSFIAFCPFTGVCAEGATELEAGRKWKEEARRQFNRYFYLPELYLTTRKVWYGEADNNVVPSPNHSPHHAAAPLPAGAPINTTNNNAGGTPLGTTLGGVLPFTLPLPQSQPQSKELEQKGPKSFFVIDNYTNAEQAVAFSPQSKDVRVGKGVEELSGVDDLPLFWSDWKVTCTPLLHRNWFFSLTPHCINW